MLRQSLAKIYPVVRCCSTGGERHIKGILSENFPKASSIIVKDVSGGCGAMYQVIIESEEFRGLSVLKQHRMVKEVLKSDIKDIHGLTLSTKAL